MRSTEVCFARHVFSRLVVANLERTIKRNYELETRPNLLTRNINLQQMHCPFQHMIQPQLLPHHHACRSVLLPVPWLGTSSSYSVLLHRAQ